MASFGGRAARTSSGWSRPAWRPSGSRWSCTRCCPSHGAASTSAAGPVPCGEAAANGWVTRCPHRHRPPASPWNGSSPATASTCRCTASRPGTPPSPGPRNGSACRPCCRPIRRSSRWCESPGSATSTTSSTAIFLSTSHRTSQPRATDASGPRCHVRRASSSMRGTSPRTSSASAPDMPRGCSPCRSGLRPQPTGSRSIRARCDPGMASPAPTSSSAASSGSTRIT